MSGHLRALAAALALAALPAHADRTITVDGTTPDWVGVTSCFAETKGDQVVGVDLIRVCLENDNSSGNDGSLYVLFETQSNRPSNTPLDLGVYIDKTNDGLVNVGDELWNFHFNKGSDSTPLFLQVRNPVDNAILRTYASTADCGGPAGANGWASYGTAKVIEGRLSYGCLGLTTGTDNLQMGAGQFGGGDVTPMAFYDGVTGTLVPATVPPDVGVFDVVARDGAVELEWKNPTAHEGVLVLRSTSGTPTGVPAKGTVYAVGQALGNGTVAYLDQGGSAVSSWTDSGRANGTRYHYRVFNHHQRFTFAPGNAPSSSGLWATPAVQTTPSPLHCVSYGFPSVQQPTLLLQSALYTAHNGGAVVSQQSSSDLAATGRRQWPGVQVQGAVQSRPTSVPLIDGPRYLLFGDQTGRAYAVNSATGALKWTANGGAALGTAIQAQPAAQLYNYANSAFRAANAGRDLVFVATRNSSTTTNRVVALDGNTGAVVWSYAPGNLDIVSGGMTVDYVNNRVWVTSRGAPSVRVLSSLTGALVTSFSVGDVDHAPVRDSTSNQVYVVTNAGVGYGYNPDTLAQVWTVNVGGATASFLLPTGNSFVAALKSGAVRKFTLSGATATQAWSTAVAGPSGAYALYGTNHLYVGSSNGSVYQLDFATGAVTASAAVSSSGLGTPIVDFQMTPARLMVGGLDGRVCALALPLP